MTEPKTIQIYADTRGLADCKATTCRARIEWAEIVASGKRMCFNAPIAVLSEHTDPVSRRRVQVVDLATNHWAACPAREQFARKGRS